MTEPYLKDVHFLVVDNYPFMRSIIKSVLRALGVISIAEASDGGTALEAMKAMAPDIILVDWEMHPINGIELVKWLRRGDHSPDPFVPIIMLSSHSEHNRVLEARDAGINEFVVKPISAKALFKRIQQVIESPRSFVKSKDYFGPDRRRHSVPFQGDERRKTKLETNS